MRKKAIPYRSLPAGVAVFDRLTTSKAKKTKPIKYAASSEDEGSVSSNQEDIVKAPKEDEDESSRVSGLQKYIVRLLWRSEKANGSSGGLSLESIVEQVQSAWPALTQHVRKRNGQAYGADCRRAVIAVLSNSVKPLFTRLAADGNSSSSSNSSNNNNSGGAAPTATAAASAVWTLSSYARQQLDFDAVSADAERLLLPATDAERLLAAGTAAGAAIDGARPQQQQQQQQQQLATTTTANAAAAASVLEPTGAGAGGRRSAAAGGGGGRAAAPAAASSSSSSSSGAASAPAAAAVAAAVGAVDADDGRLLMFLAEQTASRPSLLLPAPVPQQQQQQQQQRQHEPQPEIVPQQHEKDADAAAPAAPLDAAAAATAGLSTWKGAANVAGVKLASSMAGGRSRSKTRAQQQQQQQQEELPPPQQPPSASETSARAGGSSLHKRRRSSASAASAQGVDEPEQEAEGKLPQEGKGTPPLPNFISGSAGAGSLQEALLAVLRARGGAATFDEIFAAIAADSSSSGASLNSSGTSSSGGAGRSSSPQPQQPQQQQEATHDSGGGGWLQGNKKRALLAALSHNPPGNFRKTKDGLWTLTPRAKLNA